jgi:hypothetical protein
MNITHDIALSETLLREDFLKQRTYYLAKLLKDVMAENEELKKKLQELTPATMETE